MNKKRLEMWTQKCKCGTILHQMFAPCFECRKQDSEKEKSSENKCSSGAEIKQMFGL